MPGPCAVIQPPLFGLSRRPHLSQTKHVCQRLYRQHARCVLASPAQYSQCSDNPKVAVFVEPSPFSHVSGMKIRFSNLIKELRHLGSEVIVFTPCVDPPKSYCGAKVS